MSEPTPLELGEFGLTEAFDRLSERVGTQADPRSVLVSLGEITRMDLRARRAASGRRVLRREDRGTAMSVDKG
jgi:hypothetical protein